MTDDLDQAALLPGYYLHWVEDHVRYRDLDVLGHCNSAVYSTFFESARVALLDLVGHKPVGYRHGFAVVRQTIHYRRELHLGAQLRIGTRVIKLGRTSVALANAIFSEAHCAATAEIVGVVISMESRRPVELPPDLREGLSAYL